MQGPLSLIRFSEILSPAGGEVFTNCLIRQLRSNPIGIRCLKTFGGIVPTKETEVTRFEYFTEQFQPGGGEDRETNPPQGSLFKRRSPVRYSLGPVFPLVSLLASSAMMLFFPGRVLIPRFRERFTRIYTALVRPFTRISSTKLRLASRWLDKIERSRTARVNQRLCRALYNDLYGFPVLLPCGPRVPSATRARPPLVLESPRLGSTFSMASLANEERNRGTRQQGAKEKATCK